MVKGYDDKFRPSTTQEANEILAQIHEQERTKWENTPPDAQEELKGLRRVTSETLDNPTHVIPELLQNADDIGADCTEVTIELTEGLLVFQNHGGSMTVENVEALGAYTRSTKRGDLKSIGHFGIGFKTVFSLTDTAYIHSDYFSFKYTADERTLPEPVKPSEQPASDAERVDGTIVALPLTSDAQTDRREIVENQLESIGSLLPFLNNVETVNTSVFGEQKTCRRKPTEDGGFEVIVKKDGAQIESERVRLFSGSFEPDQDTVTQLAEKRSLDVNVLREQNLKLDVKIAVPLDDTGAPTSSDKSHLFCYFPTDPNTHLPFHIQADFSLKPDRKHIIWPDEFNKKLLACVSDVFEKAFIQFHREQVDPSRILELVPDPTHERDETPYIRQVVDEIVSFVYSESCVPDGEDNLFQPSEVIFIKNPFTSLFSEEDLSQLLDRDVRLPSKNISDTARQRLQAIVPESRVSIEELLQHSPDSTVFESKTNTWLIKFLAGIMRHWNAEYESSSLGYPDRETRQAQREFKTSLRSVPCLPLEAGRTTSLAAIEATLYKLDVAEKDEFETFDATEDVTLLSTDFVATITNPPEELDLKREASLASDVLFDELLMIPTLKPRDVVTEVINPAFEAEHLTPEQADRYVLFIAKRPGTLSDIATIKLRTDGTSDQKSTPQNNSLSNYRRPETLYFGPEYFDSYDTDILFGVFDGVTPVSPHYLELGDLPKEEWIEALSKLGVRDRIPVETQDLWDSDRFQSQAEAQQFLDEQGDNGKTELHPEEALFGYNGTKDKWNWMKRENRHGRVTKYKYGFIDEAVPEDTQEILTKLTEGDANEATRNFWKEFLKMLDEWWDSYYRDKVYRTYKYSKRQNTYRIHEGDCYCPSSFGTFLQTASWAPGTDGHTHEPQNLFTRNSQTEGKPVAFIEPSPRSAELTEFLRLRRTPGVQVILSALKQDLDRFQRNLEDTSHDAIERTIRKHLWAIDEQCSTPDGSISIDGKVHDQLTDFSFLYVRGAETKFRGISQVTWSGQGFGDYLVPVSDVYTDAWPLLEALGVKQEPELHDFISFLGHANEDASVEDPSTVSDLEEAWWQILQHTVYISQDQIDKPTDPLPDTSELLAQQGAILTAADTLTSRDKVKYFSDDPGLLANLPERIQKLVVHPERNRRYSGDVYEARIATLTDTTPLKDALDRTLVNTVSDRNESHTLIEAYPQLLNVAYSYLQHHEIASADRLLQLAGYGTYQVEEIACRYLLDGEYVITTRQNRCFVDPAEGTVVLKNDTRASFALIDAVVRELELSQSNRETLVSLMKGALGKPDPMVQVFLEDSEYEFQKLPTEAIPAPPRENDEEPVNGEPEEDLTPDSPSDQVSEPDVEEPGNEIPEDQPSGEQEPRVEEPSNENPAAQPKRARDPVEEEPPHPPNKNSTGDNPPKTGPEPRPTTRNDDPPKTGPEPRPTTRNDDGPTDSPVGNTGTPTRGSSGGSGFAPSSEDKTEIGNHGEKFVFEELQNAAQTFFETTGQLHTAEENEQTNTATIRGVSNGEEQTIKIADVSEQDRGYDIQLKGATIDQAASKLVIKAAGQQLETLIEAKATKHDTSSGFYLTPNEYRMALNRPDDYVVVRVHKVLTQDPYVSRLFSNFPGLNRQRNGIRYTPDGVFVYY